MRNTVFAQTKKFFFAKIKAKCLNLLRDDRKVLVSPSRAYPALSHLIL